MKYLALLQGLTDAPPASQKDRGNSLTELTQPPSPYQNDSPTKPTEPTEPVLSVLSVSDLGVPSPEADRIASLDAERNARDQAIGRGYDYATKTDAATGRQGVTPNPLVPSAAKAIEPAFNCRFCLNDLARCEWCADHVDDPGVISCGNCERGRMQRAAVSWRRDATMPPNSRGPLIPDTIRAVIEAVEVEARALGWAAELLWNVEFWDSPRGLAALLDEGDAIAEVTPDYIEILKAERRIWRFQRRAS